MNRLKYLSISQCCYDEKSDLNRSPLTFPGHQEGFQKRDYRYLYTAALATSTISSTAATGCTRPRPRPYCNGEHRRDTSSDTITEGLVLREFVSFDFHQ